MLPTFIIAQAQLHANTKAISDASVTVMVTNTKKVPRKSEEVIFISDKSGKQFSTRTDVKGKGMTSLPSGDIYSIKLKTMNDTTRYSVLEIPALGPGEYFEAPIVVEIEYEPARTYTLHDVHFAVGKPTLQPGSFRELNEIADYMKLQEGENFEISGHTDNVGRDADNLRLSQLRAESVKAYLVKKGVSASRLTAKGYGASKPVADNQTEEGRQKNRRTEVAIL
jgi:outer membrane protein OmpA-like peptidoglycan-associated protein